MSRRDVVIGLTGDKGAGKDTCARLMERHGFTALAFADALRAEIAEWWVVGPHIFHDRVTKEQPLQSLAIGMCQSPDFLRWAIAKGWAFEVPRSPRWLMQHYGTEYRRELQPDYWVTRLHERLVYLQASGRRRLVITDVRMPNEQQYLQGRGGHLVRVVRPSLQALQPREPQHESDRTDRLQAVAEIHNDGSIEQLQDECTRVLQQLGVEPLNH